MGQLYSHLVFRPPNPTTYDSKGGQMRYVCKDSKTGLPIVRSATIVWLKTAVGSLIPAAWVRKPKSQHVILFAHSNGDDLGIAMVEAQRLADALDVSVLAFDYTGYGISELPPRAKRYGKAKPSLLESDRLRATPSELACYADIHAAYTYLARDCSIPPRNIILVGRSIGSGPVVHCAARNPVGGVVLVAPIASAVRVALRRVNVTLPLIDVFANIDKVARIRCPVLVVHGDRDELVPIRHAQLLLARARTAVEPLFIPSAAHNNVVEDNQSLVFRRCRGFLREVQDIAAHDRNSTLPIRTSHDIGVGLIHFARTLRRRAEVVSSKQSKCIRATHRCIPSRKRRRTKSNLCQSTVSTPANISTSTPRVVAHSNQLSKKERMVYGRNHPEIFVADDPSGSMHIDEYGEAVYRGPPRFLDPNKFDDLSTALLDTLNSSAAHDVAPLSTQRGSNYTSRPNRRTIRRSASLDKIQPANSNNTASRTDRRRASSPTLPPLTASVISSWA